MNQSNIDVMAVEAGPSRIAAQQQVDQPSADDLLALSQSLADPQMTNGESIVQLFEQARRQQIDRRTALEAQLLQQAPAYVKLHNDLHASRSLLGELEAFLDVFYTDLNVLSSQMSQLQQKSILLGQQLRNRRQLEQKLRSIVADIVLEPHYVDLIFADETTAGRAGLEVWKGCADRLSACLIACTELESVLRQELKPATTSTQSPMDVKALREARDLAEGCRIMAVSKIRPLLISTFAPLRTSLSTNMPVLQAVLLKSYRPLFMFLSHHAPRVAIDVQRAYVAAARLYFETGFRRYERSMGKLRDRTRTRGAAMGDVLSSASSAATSSSSSTTFLSFTDPPAKSTAGGIASNIGVSFLGSSSGGASSSSSSLTSTDPWAIDADQLENAKIADGPAVVLAYLADDASYRASIEALFRSLSLTFLDNATSEYCFLARFFEGLDLDTGVVATSRGGSQTTGSSSVVKVRHADAQDGGADALLSADDDGPLPEDSASAKGDDENEVDAATDGKVATAPSSGNAAGTVVRLSEMEKLRIRGRGAIDELWKQVMEPVVGTYNHFVTSVLASHPPLMPLYTMLKLNDRILVEVEERGAARILQATFMSFKLKAWPTMQKQFDDAIEAVKRLRTTGGGSASTMTSAASGLLGGLFSLGGGGGGSSGGTGTGASGTGANASARSNVLHLVCERYARLFSGIAQLHSADKDEQESATIFATLVRLRAEIEALLKDTVKQQQKQQQGGQAERIDQIASCCRLIRETLESGPASLSMPRMQSEMSHWAEAERNQRQAMQ